MAPLTSTVAVSSQNMGNLETAAGNYERAMDFFNRAVDIWIAQGDEGANQLALIYLCIGRVDSLRKDYDKAARRFSTAENLFVRTLGSERHIMAQ
jgi:tetratricopeptide (TPR) repeat protein